MRVYGWGPVPFAIDRPDWPGRNGMEWKGSEMRGGPSQNAPHPLPKVTLPKLTLTGGRGAGRVCDMGTPPSPPPLCSVPQPGGPAPSAGGATKGPGPKSGGDRSGASAWLIRWVSMSPTFGHSTPLTRTDAQPRFRFRCSLIRRLPGHRGQGGTRAGSPSAGG